MKRRLSLVLLLTFALLGLSAALMQGNFIQCITLVNCGFSANSDIINGSQGDDNIQSFPGNDLIFGNGGNDLIMADEGNDVVFGGLGADTIWGLYGNDTLLPGPDLPDAGQLVGGFFGDDTFTVFAGEVTTCLVIIDEGDDSFDVANLIGFGPYIGISTFGQAGFVTGWVHLVDPIAGGDIYIFITEENNRGIEVINGLLMPNVSILPGNPLPIEVDECLGSAPRGTSPADFSPPANP